MYRHSRAARDFIEFVGVDTFPVLDAEPEPYQRGPGRVYVIAMDRVAIRVRKKILQFWKTRFDDIRSRVRSSDVLWNDIVVHEKDCRLNPVAKKGDQ